MARITSSTIIIAVSEITHTLLMSLPLRRALVKRGHVVSAIAAYAGNLTKISPFESIFIIANST